MRRIGRKILSVLLICVIALPVMKGTPLQAEGAYEKYLVRVRVEDDFRYAYMLKDASGNCYFSANTIEYYTGYHLDTEADEWHLYHYEREITKSYNKDIYIDPKKEKARLKQYEVDLPDIPDYEDAIWLPIAEIMPMLDTVMYVDKGDLYLDQSQVSLLDALNNLPIETLYFDAEKEFKGQSWRDTIKVGSAYLYETLKGIQLHKLTALGSYNDFKTIFTEYMVDRDVYEQVYTFDTQELKNIQSTAKQLQQTYSLFFKSLKVIRYGAGVLDEMEMDSTVATEAFDEIIPEDVFEGMEELGDGLEFAQRLVDYYSNTSLMVHDNYQMLKAVYPEAVKQKPAFTRRSEEGAQGGSKIGGAVSSHLKRLFQHITTKHKAVKTIYSDYSKLDLWNLTRHMLEETVVDKGADAAEKWIVSSVIGINPIIIAGTKLAGAVTDYFLEEFGVSDTGGMSRLNHHIIAENDALDAYNYYISQVGVDYTWENLNNVRLSAMMTLLSAKKCFEIIRDNNAGKADVEEYCNGRIEQIAERLTLLYLAKEGVLTDGEEFFIQQTKDLRNTLSQVQTEKEDPVLPVYGWWARVNLDEDRRQEDYIYLADVTGDGQKEMIVTHYGPEGQVKPLTYGEYEFNQGDDDFDYSDYLGEGIFMQIYTIVGDEVRLIQEIPASFSHIGQMLMILYPYEQSYAIANIQNTEYQGYKSYGYSVFRPEDANANLTAGNYWENDKRTELDSGYWDTNEIPDDIKDKLQTALEEGIIVLNTQYPNLPFGLHHYDSWFMYQEIDGVSEAEQKAPNNDDVSVLNKGLWITSMDNNTLWLQFEGTQDDLTMNFGVTEWNVDYTTPVSLEPADDPNQIRIRDGGAISKSLPEFYQSEYTLTLDRTTGRITLDLGSDSMWFEDIS